MTDHGGDLHAVTDLSVTEWIAPRLGPFGGQVGSVVPHGFQAYARVLHPPQDLDGRSTTWSAVCAATGRQAHALMQWHAVARTATPSAWQGSGPSLGRVPLETLTTLLRTLSSRNLEVPTYFAVWDGYGELQSGQTAAFLAWPESETAPPSPPSPALPASVIDGPCLRLPHRDYIVLSGPLSAATTIGARRTPTWFAPVPPNLVWPCDRSWFVGTEVDFDCTIVAGSLALVEAVLRAPGLETWPIDVEDCLGAFDDTVNAD